MSANVVNPILRAYPVALNPRSNLLMLADVCAHSKRIQNRQVHERMMYVFNQLCNFQHQITFASVRKCSQQRKLNWDDRAISELVSAIGLGTLCEFETFFYLYLLSDSEKTLLLKAA